MIKLVIADLDDTLLLYPSSFRPGVFRDLMAFLRREGVPKDRIAEFKARFRKREQTQLIILGSDLPKVLKDKAVRKLVDLQVEGVARLVPEDGAKYLLRSLRQMGIGTAIVTVGLRRLQIAKMKQMGFRSLVDRVVYLPAGNDKVGAISALARGFGAKPSEVLVVGDSARTEIAAAKSLGMHAAQFMKGRFSRIPPVKGLEPDCRIRKLKTVGAIVGGLGRGRK